MSKHNSRKIVVDGDKVRVLGPVDEHEQQKQMELEHGGNLPIHAKPAGRLPEQNEQTAECLIEADMPKATYA